MADTPTDNSSRLDPFWPVLMIAVSLLFSLGWGLVVAAQQAVGASRALAQQRQVMLQTAQVEERIKALMVDLIALARQNENAAEIVRKYNISYAPTPGQPPVPGAGD